MMGKVGFRGKMDKAKHLMSRQLTLLICLLFLLVTKMKEMNTTDRIKPLVPKNITGTLC